MEWKCNNPNLLICRAFPPRFIWMTTTNACIVINLIFQIWLTFVFVKTEGNRERVSSKFLTRPRAGAIYLISNSMTFCLPASSTWGQGPKEAEQQRYCWCARGWLVSFFLCFHARWFKSLEMRKGGDCLLQNRLLFEASSTRSQRSF